MRTEHRHAHLHERRSGDCRGYDVVGRRRHAHAEDDGRDHREEHRRQQQAAREVQESRGQLESDTRLRHDADDDAGRGAGDEDREHVARAAVEAADDLDRLHARRLAQG